MSDHSGQSLTSYQSGWMSRWGKNGSKEIALNNNCSSSSLMNKETGHPSSRSPITSGKEVASSGCSPAKALEEIKSGFTILKPETSKMTSTGMETRKLLSFPSTEGSQAAASDIKDNLDFDTKLSLGCYVPPEADKSQSMGYHSEAKGVPSQSSKETMSVNPLSFSKDLDVSSPDMLQLKLGQMSMPELEGSTESQRISKALVTSTSGAKQFQDAQKMMVVYQPNKVCSSSLQMQIPQAGPKPNSTQTSQISTGMGLGPRTVGPYVKRLTPCRRNYKPVRLYSMPPPPPPGSSSEFVRLHPIVDNGKSVLDELNQKEDAATEKMNKELDEYILQETLKRSISSPPSKMLKLTLPNPELTLAAPKPIKPIKPIALKPSVGNLELSTLPVGAASSKTESLGLETLLTDSQTLHQCKAEWCPGGSSSKPEPGTSWIKRLKLSSSDFSGSRISSIEELHPDENKAQIPEQSEPTKVNGVELVVLDEDEDEAPKKASPEPSWMRRWGRALSAAPQTKPPQRGRTICDPNSKLALPEIPEKQFPSIAAMALMGKAMNGFKPGEYKTKGSVTVWNDEGY